LPIQAKAVSIRGTSSRRLSKNFRRAWAQQPTSMIRPPDSK
jgi:hypothetical protein